MPESICTLPSRRSIASRESRVHRSCHTLTQHIKFRRIDGDSPRPTNKELSDEDSDFPTGEVLGLGPQLEEPHQLRVGTRNFNKSFYAKMASKVMQKPLSFYKFGLK